MIHCVIPHFGDEKLAQAASASVQRQTILHMGIGIQTQIVNNNPPNPNRLFTGAVNEGLLNALAACDPNGWDVAWILNNDAVAEPECAAEALRCMVDTERCGIVGSRNVDPANPDHIVWGGSGRIFPVGQHKCGSVFRGDLAQRSLELWCTFSSVFISMRLVREIGVLDPNLAHVCSDSDYCLRAAWNGWTSAYEPRSVVQHAHRSSADGKGPLGGRMNADVRLMHWKWMYGWFGIPRLHFPPCPELVPGGIEPIPEEKNGAQEIAPACAGTGPAEAAAKQVCASDCPGDSATAGAGTGGDGGQGVCAAAGAGGGGAGAAAGE